KTAENKAQKVAERATEEQAKREAEEATKAKTAENKAQKVAELATEEQAKREAEEATKAKTAENKAQKVAELATEEQAKREAEGAEGTELYEGIVELTIVSPVVLGQMKKLEKYLRQVQDLHIELISGSVDEGTTIVVSAAKAIPLVESLKEMPPVQQVVKEGNKVQITLKVE
ncbi:hypothetical protein ACFLTO_06705, partial [Chloroflexota bacterium]